MFVHIHPETLRRHPIIGILIGVATTAVVVWLLAQGWSEFQALLAQKAPTPLSVHDVVNLSGVRWVTIADGEWHCDRALTIKRRSELMRWVLGPVESTEVPITGTSEGDLLVASFDGAPKCEERTG